MDVILIFFLSVISKLLLSKFAVVEAHGIAGLTSKNPLDNCSRLLLLRRLNNCWLPNLDGLLVLPQMELSEQGLVTAHDVQFPIDHRHLENYVS